MKRVWSLISLLVVIALVCAGCSGEEAATDTTGEPETYSWKFATEEGPGAYQTIYAEEFANRIAEKSDGRIQIEVFPLGVLGNDVDIFEATIEGAIQFCTSSPGVAATIVPRAQYMLLHYIWSENDEVNNRMLKNFETSPAMQGITREYETKNVEVLGFFNEGWMYMTSNTPIRSIDDLEGLKIRTMRSPLLLDVYNAYGATPTSMSFSEVYSSLQLNVIDGLENPVYFHYIYNIHEVQDFVINTKSYCYITAAMANKDFFNNLPTDIQEMILSTSEEMYDFWVPRFAELNASAIELMKQANPDLEYIEMAPEEIARFREASMTVRDNYAELVGEDSAEFLQAFIDEIAVLESDM